MILVPYFETIISNTCVVRYAYICADVAIIEDYCYARCLPVSRAAPHYRCSQPGAGIENQTQKEDRDGGLECTVDLRRHQP